MLHADLSATLKVDSSADCGVLRLALHRVDWDADESVRLEQVVDYVGGCVDESGGRTRRFPMRCGVIGRCAKDGEPIYAHRRSPDPRAFSAELVRSWSFTKEEAERLTCDRWSYAAYPILLQGHARAGAVLYADTSIPNAFRSQAVRNRLKVWCLGFAEYLRARETERLNG
jgi:hypothetical protein